MSDIPIEDRPPQEPFDASDPKQVQDKRTKAGRERKEQYAALRKLLATPAGRTWLWRLLEASHIYATSFVQGDAHATSFQEGERNLGLRILSDVLAADPQAFLTMSKENKSA